MASMRIVVARIVTVNHDPSIVSFLILYGFHHIK